MIIREATVDDITQMHIIRNAVKENVLSNPDLITHNDYEAYITNRGKGWLCEFENEIVGFAIVDVKENNVWALFIHPIMELRGIGKQLHKIMMDWYFTQTNKTIWLSTSKYTKAEKFYAKAGWQAVGNYGKTEVKFEMSFEHWMAINKRNQ